MPNEFLQGDEISIDTISKLCLKSLDAPEFSLSRHNSSRQLPSELPADLLSARLAWAQRGRMVPILHPLYNGPYAVLCQGPHTFTLQVRQQEEIIAVSRLKVCTTLDATLGSPRRSRLSGPGMTATAATANPGGPAATKRVLFSDPLVSSLPQQKQSRIRPGSVFLLPCGEIFVRPGPTAPSQPPQKWYLQCQRKLPMRIDL
jgi:hypothetical protein